MRKWILTKTTPKIQKLTSFTATFRPSFSKIGEIFTFFKKNVGHFWNFAEWIFLTKFAIFLSFFKKLLEFSWKCGILEFGFSSILPNFQNFWTFEFFLPMSEFQLFLHKSPRFWQENQISCPRYGGVRFVDGWMGWDGMSKFWVHFGKFFTLLWCRRKRRNYVLHFGIWVRFTISHIFCSLQVFPRKCGT